MTLEVEGVSPTERAKDIARRVLSGAYDPLLACRDLADLRRRLPGIPDEIMDTFIGVASEIDDLPIGVERAHWAANALRTKDVEAADYRERVQGMVQKALARLLASLGG